MAATENTDPTRILCLGAAVVDLICEEPLGGSVVPGAFVPGAFVPGAFVPGAFVPHFGGAVANAAVSAARGGAQVTLAGGAGEDVWGEWLHDRLTREGVDTSLFLLAPELTTPLALATIDAAGDPGYRLYGQDLSAVIPALTRELPAAVTNSAALFLGSNTLVEAAERELTMRARELALEHDRPVIFDPSLRLERWSSRADAQASANACVPGALLVRVNLSEAQVMTGEADPERAATALLKAGARMVAMTFGEGGAMLRGEYRADVPAVEARVRSTIGAGDAFTGVLLAQLAKTGFYPPAVPASMRLAAVAAARACERWGALD